MVESQTEETPLSFQRDSARVLRFMYLDFMESKTVHFVHSRKCELSSNQFLCVTWHGRIRVSQKNGLETC